MEQMVYKTCDVLIVGSGLAGLRAGISALCRSRDLKVCIATQGHGASGSSFTNPNQALGMVVCHNSREKEAFVKTAMDIASPGIVFPELVSILAEESDFFYHDLVQSGLDFVQNDDRQNRRHSACFLREPPTAYVFKGLASAYLLLNKRFFENGGETFEGLSLVDLVSNEEGRVIGGLFQDIVSGKFWAIRCQALVMATGGAAGLFPRHLTDSKNLGIPLALMHQAGAHLINMNFLQYLWYRKDPWEHWPIWTAGHTLVKDAQGKDGGIPEFVRPLLKERSTHVPVAHGRKDSEVDALLCDYADSRGRVRIRNEAGETYDISLYAHALNGGALIDAMARTRVPGLFAAGECAGGMHGANRVGGAMVLSSQVFGHRAGMSAARFAHDPDQESRRRFMDRVRQRPALGAHDTEERKAGLEELKQILAGSEGPFPRPGLEGRARLITGMVEKARDHRLKQALACARLILS